MSGGAIAFMVFGIVITWGGAAVCISIAMRAKK
ncbi:MAG: MetS family NSS transporter small subunit [Alkalispirochaeta sp.]